MSSDAPTHASWFVVDLRVRCLYYRRATDLAMARTVLNPYVEHYNAGRAHRSLGLRAPDDDPNVVPLPAATVRGRQVLGGLLNECHTLTARLPHHPQETPSSAA
ncbi:integrase core domain-containing protein [Streptomyces sp. NPDC000941]